jgi:hypothetical protein
VGRPDGRRRRSYGAAEKIETRTEYYRLRATQQRLLADPDTTCERGFGNGQDKQAAEDAPAEPLGVGAVDDVAGDLRVSVSRVLAAARSVKALR